MSAYSEHKTKADEQYEKRVIMTAIILTRLQKSSLSFAELRAITPSYHSYAKNDAIKYLTEHGYIKVVDGEYHLA